MPRVYSCRDCQVDFTLNEDDELRCPRCHSAGPSVRPAGSGAGRDGASWPALVIGLPLVIGKAIWDDLLPSDWSHGKKLALVLGFLVFVIGVIVATVVLVP